MVKTSTRLKPITPYYCQNPECNKQIDPKKWKQKPKHCNRDCQKRHLEIERGMCQRPGCKNYLPPGSKDNRYCSQECLMIVVYVPRQPCQRPGCTNTCKLPHAKYCSKGCRDAVLDLSEMSKKGQAVIKAHKEITGKVPKYEKRAAAVSRNNKKAPPKKKMYREDIIYGYQAIFEPSNGEYRASVPEVPGIITRAKTKKEAYNELKRMMREASIPAKRKVKTSGGL